MTQGVIRIECEGATTKNLDELTDFQGELKSLSTENYLRLKKEILTEGFAFPIQIWQDIEAQKTYIIGGHQRVKTLKKMRDEEGYDIPPLPVAIIYARNWKQAKRRVLQDVAQYGKIEKQGLYEFTTHAEIAIEDLVNSFDIPNVDLNLFQREFGIDTMIQDPSNEWDGMPEFNQSDKTSFRHVIVHFATQEAIDQFFKLISREDTGNTKSFWFPNQENMDTESKRYE